MEAFNFSEIMLYYKCTQTQEIKRGFFIFFIGYKKGQPISSQ